MSALRDVTLVFLVQKSESDVTDICLALKKRGFGTGRWNGVGGKVEPGETIVQAAKREAYEEIEVHVQGLYQVAELDFYFPHNPVHNQRGHVYFCEDWQGEPVETEEMKPQWFTVDAIPYDSMWIDDQFWLPSVLVGKCIQASFTFAEHEQLLEQNIKEVNSF